jgi:hypothetical protein
MIHGSDLVYIDLNLGLGACPKSHSIHEAGTVKGVLSFLFSIRTEHPVASF